MTGLLVRKNRQAKTFINFDYVEKVKVVNNYLVVFSESGETIEEFNEYYKDGQWNEISSLEELSDLLNTK